MPLHLAAGAGLDQAVGHCQLCVQVQAHALGLAGGAGGVGDLAGARMQLCRLRDRAVINIVFHAGEAGGTSADQAVDAGTVEHMALLLGGEEPRYRHADQAGMQRRQIPQHPVDTVIQRQCHALGAQPAQTAAATGHGCQQTVIGQLMAILGQRRVRAKGGQTLEEGFNCRPHRASPPGHTTVDDRGADRRPAAAGAGGRHECRPP